MNKIFIVLPDGVGIRNYLYSSVFKGTRKKLILFHNFDSDTISYLKSEIEIAAEIVIPNYIETKEENFLRELICLARLKSNAKITKNKSILTNWNWKHKTISKIIFYKIIEALSLFFKKYSNILKLEKQYQKSIRKNEFYKQVSAILIEQRPQKIFCTHQRGLKMATIFAAASDIGIPTITAIYSWDNLPKARLALRSDEYYVWSDYMKQEMKLYYPEISQDKVIVTGTPQFEFYKNKENIIDKEAFYKKYNLDFDKKIICFSGDDEKTSPDDSKYLEDLAHEITKSGLENQYQILFRRSPIDFSGRYDSILKKYPSLLKQTIPIWNYKKGANWTTMYPTNDDVKLLVTTVFYSDIVVNLGSTMAFDFAMYNKPCIFINYDQKKKVNTDWNVDTIYKFQHFRSMPSKEAVIWLNSKNEIADKISNYNVYKNDAAMQNWSNIIKPMIVNKY